MVGCRQRVRTGFVSPESSYLTQIRSTFFFEIHGSIGWCIGFRASQADVDTIYTPWGRMELTITAKVTTLWRMTQAFAQDVRGKTTAPSSGVHNGWLKADICIWLEPDFSKWLLHHH
jgi:hypothetical protein